MDKNHLEAVQNLFENLLAEPLQGWQELLPAMKLIDAAPDEFIFHADTAQPYVFCVVKGLVKLFYSIGDGNEWIKAFAHEQMFFASIQALEVGGRASFFVQALEQSHLVQIDYAALERMAEGFCLAEIINPRLQGLRGAQGAARA